jgi:hypothetical protein
MGEFVIADYLADLDTSGTRELLLRPSYSGGKDVEIELRVSATVAVQVDVYEGTSKQYVSGNVKTVANLNRNQSEVSGLQACHTPSAGGDGTLIWSGVAAAGAPAFCPFDPRQGDMTEKRKLFLKRSTPYLIRMTGLADNNRLMTNIFVTEDFAILTSLSSSSSSSAA